MDEEFKHCGHQRQFYAGHHQKWYFHLPPSQLKIPNFEASRQHLITERQILQSSHNTDLKLEKLLSFFTFSAWCNIPFSCFDNSSCRAVIELEGHKGIYNPQSSFLLGHIHQLTFPRFRICCVIIQEEIHVQDKYMQIELNDVRSNIYSLEFPNLEMPIQSRLVWWD